MNLWGLQLDSVQLSPNVDSVQLSPTIDSAQALLIDDCKHAMRNTPALKETRMVAANPHFLLLCNAHQHDPSSTGPSRRSAGKWHFVLESIGGSDDAENTQRFEATDFEAAASNERLELLSVVRGLEALEQPSRVTLITTSKYVSRGLRYGLSSWRESDYKWERFGVQIPIRNADLWQRIDGAMQYHGVSCRLISPQLSSSWAGEMRGGTAQPSPEPATAARSSQAMDQDRGPVSGTAVRHDERGLPQQMRESWQQLATAGAKWWRERGQLRPAY